MQDEKLIRQLGRLDVFCIATGAMISSGLFILPGLVCWSISDFSLHLSRHIGVAISLCQG
jgi:hypothetical protein